MNNLKPTRIEFLPPQYEKGVRTHKLGGTRLGHEHDMNDAFFARVDWWRKYDGYLKTMEKKEDKKQWSAFLVAILLLLILSPIVTYIEYLIIWKKILGF